MRRNEQRMGLVWAGALLTALLTLHSCHWRPAVQPPVESETLSALQLDAARAMYQENRFPEARDICRNLIALAEDGHAVREALLLLAVMEITLPGDGPHCVEAKGYLEQMMEAEPTAGQAAVGGALMTLLEVLENRRQAIRGCNLQIQRLEAVQSVVEQQAGARERELRRLRRELGEAGEEVERLNKELADVLQQIKLLGEIDAMLQEEEEAVQPDDDHP